MSRKAKPPGAGQMELAFAATAAPKTEDLEPGPLDLRFAQLIIRLNGAPNATLERAAQSVSAARTAGESCLPLSRLSPDPTATRRDLLATRVVGAPGEWQPLILDAAGRLYLHRYWQYEQHLAAAIAARAIGPICPIGPISPSEDPRAADQHRAVATAVSSSFTVITGGPGTGKTRTVAEVLSSLHRLAAGQGRPVPRVALAAPTGKAAVRLAESIRQVLGAGHTIPEAVTLHRLLGLAQNSPKPRWDALHPLTAEVVIVDEASMVDLALMAKLFAAVPKTARLILLGDKDQLASVETGQVLGEICAASEALGGRVVELRQNFRFSENSSIHRLGEAVKNGDTETSLALLRTPAAADLQGSELPRPDALKSALETPVLTHYGKVLACPDPASALDALARFRILCGLREGPYGVANLNRLAEAALAGHGKIQLATRHYHGRPVMIVRNDHQLRLFNGDIGLAWADPEAGGDLRVFFRGEDGALRRLSPSRLPEHETAWAMTVHKSQGSEFHEVLLVLPDQESAVVTRELVYTAITRARSTVEVWFREAPLRAAIARRTVRASGLAEAIRAHLAQNHPAGHETGYTSADDDLPPSGTI